MASAFAIAPASAAALQRDVAPLSSDTGVRKALILFVLALFVIVLVARCSRDDCAEVKSTFGAASAEYRQCQRSSGGGIGSYGGNYGGSYGGYSSGGGGHK